MARKYALFVGNSEYEAEKLADLASPIADVQDLASLFRDSSIGGFDDVKELINSGESKVRQEISGFFQNKKPDDLLLLYFSGHGILDDRGHLYLAVRDTRPDLLRATAISADFIADDMDLCRSKRQILILDCCHSGAFRRGIKGDDQVLTAATFEGNGSGRIVLTASDRREFAMEGNQVLEQAQTSLFTHFLLEGIQSGKADKDGDSLITLDEWYDYAYDKVVSNLPTQTPRRWVYNQQGRLIIARNPRPLTPAELDPKLRAAIEDDDPVVRLEAIPELAYLLDGGDKRMALAAREALEDMQKDEKRKVREAAAGILSNYDPDRATPGKPPAVQLGEERAAEKARETDKKVSKKRPETLLKNIWTYVRSVFWQQGMRWPRAWVIGAGIALVAAVVSWQFYGIPGSSIADEDKSSTEQAEVGTAGGNIGTTLDEPEQAESLPPLDAETQSPVDPKAVNTQESTTSGMVDSPGDQRQIDEEQSANLVSNRQPVGNRGDREESEISTAGTNSSTNVEDQPGPGDESLAASEVPTEEEEPAAEIPTIELVRGQIDQLQNAVSQAIMDRQWNDVAPPLADYYGKMLEGLYSRFNVVSVESRAGELQESGGTTATLAVTMDIHYRQKGREEVKILPVPANWIWKKNEERYVLSEVEPH
ncbi:caspase family protein [Halalkalibaculum sp. DA384]|uniref:caspase, EACC1-associated type n=1 Tax=Halalkalibaculum sp. DA384 TaxID=3373606 RepID=UPI0037541D87